MPPFPEFPKWGSMPPIPPIPPIHPMGAAFDASMITKEFSDLDNRFKGMAARWRGQAVIFDKKVICVCYNCKDATAFFLAASPIVKQIQESELRRRLVTAGFFKDMLGWHCPKHRGG